MDGIMNASLVTEKNVENSPLVTSTDTTTNPKVTKHDIRLNSKSISVNETSIDLRTSLQACQDDGLAFLLNYQYQEARRLGHIKKEKKLNEIHSHLLLKPDVGNAKHIGYIDFDTAYELYCGHQENAVEKKDFRDILLHPDYGLHVHIVNFLEYNRRYIILKTSELDVPNFVAELLTMVTSENEYVQEYRARFEIKTNSLKCILNSMDSEWDRKCAKLLIAANRSRTEIEELGIHPDSLVKSMQNVKAITEEIERAKVAAGDCVMLRLRDKTEHLKSQIDGYTSLIEKKNGVWKDHLISEVKDKLDIAKEQLDDNAKYIKCLENPDEADKYVKQKIQQRVKRTAENLVESHRMKKRKLGAGPNQQLDSSDEEFIAKAIEDKATYHGRRHNPVMFTNRRVKKGDLLTIANYRLLQKGKKLIKSATTPWNRSRPKNVRSRQAKLHIGKGLFCTKKPPKAEDCDNENTHHQRSHCKNVQQFLSSDKSKQKFSFIKSMDDKAYIRPGTSEGLEKTRNTKILTLSGEGARQLPKYDWPEKAVYQTPAAHRIMEKESITMDDGSEKLITVNDNHIVIVRPKSYVPSSGTMWANETHRLRCVYPDMHEVEPEDAFVKYSANFRQFCSSLYGDVYLLDDMTMEEDLKKMSASEPCPHKEYELKRLTHFLHRVDICFDAVEVTKNVMSEQECELIKNIQSSMIPLINHCSIIVEALRKDNCPEIGSFMDMKSQADEILKHLGSLKLPQVKPRWAEFTDAGPGVGVNNVDVKVRSAELDRLYNRDYRIRVHRSRGDSGQNEAERTNSAIGDAVVDGATIKWEHYKRFHGMTKEEIADLTIEEFDALEDQRMERNAWRITHQLAERIDGAPVLSDFINGIASESPDDMFFFNDNYLSQYTSKSKSLRATVPGASYFDKIFTFIELHLQTGELYTEFLKESCKKTLGTSCEYCLKNPWSGPVMTRIPRPFPSADDLPEFHYKNVHSTPLTDSKGNDRGPDDWQPRANIKKLFEQKKLSLEDNEEIKKFSQAFIVDEKYVRSYLEHLSSLETISKIREKQRKDARQERKKKEVSDYNWQELIENGKLPSLVVSELDKYLIHYNLSKTGKKKDKIRRITVHYYNQDRRAVPDDQPVADFDQQFGSEDSENESDSDEDLVLCDSSSDSDSDSSDCDGDEEGGSAEVLTSRSGRKTTQNSRFADFVLY
ncbi:uncharacterized protein LOC5510379 [Nematostella vectensis]|uniref:uncharacterized protein LOC5510379 n=1 Tax=Nematostella vectensis TaxID=45351 RepID=UPI0020775F23|nr:uncharacterized protein LOC5510379 [Nematostella vectensis]